MVGCLFFSFLVSGNWGDDTFDGGQDFFRVQILNFDRWFSF